MEQKNTEKKRYRFNIIDLLVLVVLIGLVVLLVVSIGNSYRNQKEKDLKEAEDALPVSGPPADFEWNLRYEVLSEEMDEALAKTVVEEGLRENRINNAYRMQNAYITDAVIEPAEEGKVAVRFQVLAYVNFGDYYTSVDGNFNPYVGSFDIRIGKPYTLKTMTIEVAGVITDLEVLREAQDG